MFGANEYFFFEKYDFDIWKKIDEKHNYEE